MSYFEKDAIISGIGISRIGRRTGIPGLELTMERSAPPSATPAWPPRHRRDCHPR